MSFVKAMQTFDVAAFTSQADSDMVLDPLVVCGPSGVGKGTIIAKYMEEYGGKDRFGFTVSHTTRSPRPGEVGGIHYHFSSHAAMRLEIDAGLFLEHAEVHGNLYGTSWSSMRNVQTSGKRCLLDIDVQGVRRLKALQSPTLMPTYIFIAPPSLDALEKRLADLGTESAESLARRTENARMEMEYGLEEGNFDFIVVNDDLDEATLKFSSVIAQIYTDAKQC
jgi:guanylate kinase